MNSWIRDRKLWEHMNAHMNEYSWPRACPHLLCELEASLQKITAPQFGNDEELQFHLIDEHGFSRTRPGHRDGPASATYESATLSRKRTLLNGDETLEWMSTRYFESAPMLEDRLSPSSPRKRTREITPTISPPLLSTFATEGDERQIQISSRETVPAPAHILNDVGLHDAELTPELEQPGRQWVSTCDSVGLDGETTDPDPDSETLFSLYLRSPSPTCTSVGEFSDCSSGTAVDPVSDEPLLTPSAELLSGALDPNTAEADGQSHVAAKPIRIRLRLKPPSERPQGNKIILRLKGP